MKIPDFKLERYFAKYEFTIPYTLCSSDCETYTIKQLLHMQPQAKQEFFKLGLGYTESLGVFSLREQIAKLYKNISPQDVLVYSGAQEAIFCFMNSLLDKDDHVIVHYPCYQSLFSIAKSIGCQMTKWQANEQNNWELDIDFLKRQIRPNTKAVIINCPHNPTGYLMPQEAFLKLHQLSQKHGFIIFSDEVYRFLEYNARMRLDAICEINANSVSLGVMSKAFGLAGLRIGWIATKNNDLYQKMLAFKDYTTICNSAPAEYLAILALKNKETILKRNREIIAKNSKLLEGFFGKYSQFFHWTPPQAGPIAFPKIKAEITAQEFCEKLLKKGVLLLPGDVYDKNFSQHFRIGFGRADMDTGLQKLEEFMEQGLWKKKQNP